MTLRNILPFTVATSLLALAGVAPILNADDPSDDGCTHTRDSCWNEIFCGRVSWCVNQNYNNLPDFYQCLLGGVTLYETCAENICADSYVEGQANPTSDQCWDQYEERVKYCKFQSADKKICGYSKSIFGSFNQFAEAVSSVCEKAAFEELNACVSNSTANPSSGNFYEGSVLGGALAAAAWQPSEGMSTATMVLVPMNETSARVDRAIVKSLIWIGESWEWIVLGEFERGADMCTEITIDLQNIAEAANTSELNLQIRWMDDDKLVMGSMFFLPIAESGIPGDFDRDGERNAADLSAYIDAYDHNAPRADRNGDGVVNATDLELFLIEYDAG